LAAALLTGTKATAQTNGPECPWQQNDPTDEIGASRTQTPQKALQAVRLVKKGQVYRLAHPYDETTIPLPFGRSFDVAVGFIDIEPAGASQAFHIGGVSGTGPVGTEIGQIGTQFDALGHAGHDELGFYNCMSADEIGADDLGRLKKLGAETVLPFFTRGILLDFVHNSDAPKTAAGILQDSYVITRRDVEQVLHNQRLAPPRKGDVVLFYTGWDSLFGGDEDERLGSAPGPGIEVAEWLASRKVAMVGADTQSVEALKDNVSVELEGNPEPFGPEIGALFNVVHFILLTKHGIHTLENLRLGHLAQDLLDDRRHHGRSPYEFLFVFAAVPIKGLAGSPGQPLAVR